ncbi:MAG TPA: hypothetical protein VLD19_15165, partial [Chitinophagaceae bacterium]|nr:hypothetical protein [Chitinophagaceae bacterium]
SGALQQGLKLAITIEGMQVVKAADMGFADINLRYRAASGLLHHRVALRRIEINPDLFDIFHAFCLQQLLGANAIRTHSGAIHYYMGSHYSSLHCASRILPWITAVILI